MPRFFTNLSECIRCGVCVKACPKGLIYQNEENIPQMTDGAESRCNNCGQCVAYCPTEASMQTYSERAHLEAALQYKSERSETILKFLKSRRSNRNYLPVPLTRQELLKILETANFAPSGGNNRTLRWILIEDQQKMNEMRKLIAQWFDTTCREHPVYSKRYAIDSILSRIQKGQDVIFRGAPHVVYCVGPEKATWGPVDTGIALTYFNLACEAMNIGCCFAGYATKSAETQNIRDFLGIGSEEKVWCALCFGRKSLVPYRIPNRGEVPVTFL